LVNYRCDFIYASDGSSPIGSADQIYQAGIMYGKFYANEFYKQLVASPYWLANNANPGGLVMKKVSVTGIKFKCQPVDGIPFYLALGKVTADTPASDQFTIQGSTDGDVPELVFHKENKHAPTNKQAYEFTGVKCKKLSANIEDGFLVTELEFIGEEMKDQANDNVVLNTTSPSFRGTSAPVMPYKILGNPYISVTWNSQTLSNHVQSLSFSIENDIVAELIEDGNDHATVFNRGKRTYGEIMMTLLVDTNLAVLDPDTSTKSDLVVTIPRRHANDYLKFTFKNVALKKFEFKPVPDSDDRLPLVEAVWTGATDLEVVDRQVDSSGNAAPNADADYEL